MADPAGPSIGMNRDTGRWLTGWPHVVQSMADILSTPAMTRVMRRAYGSNAPKLVDAPMNTSSLLGVYVALATALAKWEPRYELRNVAFLAADANGRAEIRLSGVYYPRGHLGDRTPDGGAERSASIVQLNESLWRPA